MVRVSPLKSAGACAAAGRAPRKRNVQVRNRSGDIGTAFWVRHNRCYRSLQRAGRLAALIGVRPIDGGAAGFKGGDMNPIGISRMLAGAALSLAALLTAHPLQAQTDPAANFPTKPIRVIVPFAAGGGNDIFARLVGQKFGEIIGQTIVIENRPAAGGRVAAEFVANQPGDGYTLFVGASGVMSISAAVYPKLAYHPTKSFVPLSMIANFPLIMVSQVNIAPKNVAKLVAYAKANPDKSNYGTTSPAFTISTELLKLKTGMPGVAIPLKSSAEMMLCVIQQQCLISIADGPPAIPQVKDGKVRALAVTGGERSSELPEVPSMAE